MQNLNDQILNTTYHQENLSDQSQITELLEEYAEVVRNGNVDHIMSYYSKNIRAFDMMPPLQFTGIEAYKKNWEEFTTMFRFPINYTFENQELEVSGEIAYVNSLLHMSGDMIHGDNVDCWLRNTMCLKKEHGRWRITHEHSSVPLDENMKGIMNLSPEAGNKAQLL